MRLVIVESPFAGDIDKNVRYARGALADCLARGEAPYASHLLYTQEGVLRDEIPAERRKGIDAGFEWNRVASLTACYIDLGISGGMKEGIRNAALYGREVEYRKLPNLAAVLRGKPKSCVVCRCPLVDVGPVRCIRCPRAPQER